MSIILSVYDHLKDNAALWIALTLIAYLFGQWVFRTAKFNPLLSPIIVAVLSIMSLLLICCTLRTVFLRGSIYPFLAGACYCCPRCTNL